MLRFTLRGLLARKVRLVLSASAIVLGVAFLSGSLTFTEMIGRSFDNIVGGSVSDGVVRLNRLGSATSLLRNLDQRTLPGSLVPQLASAPGVARADGSVEGQGLFVVKQNGKLLGGSGAPTIALNFDDAPNAAGDPTVTIPTGHEPRRAGEVAMDRRSARNAGYRIGDTVRMVTAGDQPRITARLVGYADFAGGGLAGATLVMFDTRTAQDLFLDGADAYTSIGLTAEGGVSQAELVTAVTPLLPDGVEAVTGDQVTDEVKTVVDTVLGYLNTFLLVFAAIALVVGSFLIVNTFSMLVAQRTRELALLRALGASRRQVTRSVLLEACVTGLVGSSVGLGLGLGLTALLRTVFAGFGLDLSGTSVVLSGRTVIVSYAVGVGVTMIAAWLPARRAASVSPVSAMRDDAALPEGSVRRRLVVGSVLAAAGAALVVAGLNTSGSTGTSMVGAGILAILLAVTAAAPGIAIPFVTGVRWAFGRMTGPVGRLAGNNALRNPRRTAATASALMIGLALVTTMSILGASTSRSVDAAITEQFTSDFLVSNALLQPFSPVVGDEIAQVDGVGRVARTQVVQVRIGDSTVTGSATNLEALEAIVPISFVSGSRALGDGQVAVDQDRAQSLGLRVGDAVRLGFDAGPQTARVSGIYRSTYLLGDVLVPFSTVTAASIVRADSEVLVDATPGTDTAALGVALEKATTDYPTVTVQTRQQYSDSQRAQVDQLLYLIYALLGLAIVIAALGIVNTLALSVVERTRELGLLRAIGLDRAQVRRMVRLEAVAIAALGACLGIGLGLLFGFVLQRAVVDQGVTDLAIPWARLALFVVAAVLVGVLAAVLPARRAARLDVLRAISSQ
ncbi:MAG: FtsX-like permease family protein [Aeromicrobium sp.]